MMQAVARIEWFHTGTDLDYSQGDLVQATSLLFFDAASSMDSRGMTVPYRMSWMRGLGGVCYWHLLMCVSINVYQGYSNCHCRSNPRWKNRETWRAAF